MTQQPTPRIKPSTECQIPSCRKNIATRALPGILGPNQKPLHMPLCDEHLGWVEVYAFIQPRISFTLPTVQESKKSPLLEGIDVQYPRGKLK